MTTTTTEGGQQGAGQQQAGQQGQQQQGGDQGQGGQSGQQQQGQAGQQGGQQQGAGQGQQQGGQQGQGGQQQQNQGDELSAEEEAALGDPGRRALERIREQRNTARTELEQRGTELEQTRGQLQQALAQIAAGGDQAQQQALQTATTERDDAKLQLERVQAVIRNGLAVPGANETPEQLAQRVTQVAGLLQGTDQASLDNSARVLLSLAGGQGGVQQQGQQQQQVIPPGDQNGGQQNGGQAGDMSMSDRIRAAAGRRVR